jgi:hypothetical protein
MAKCAFIRCAWIAPPTNDAQHANNNTRPAAPPTPSVDKYSVNVAIPAIAPMANPQATPRNTLPRESTNVAKINAPMQISIPSIFVSPVQHR